MTAPDSC